jgi:enoyl-CoA hydratase/carnithine racemase
LEIEAESQVVAAIITGAGEKAFCAGADLSEVVEGRLNDMFTPVGGFGGFVDAPRTKPWIAAVNGAALAGGFEIVLACDIVVATSSAIFGLPEVKRGLIASAGGLYRLPRAVPKAIALEMILTGNVITASRAYELGLVSRIAEDSQVLSEAYDLAMQVSANAPLAIRASLRLAKAANFFTDEELKTEGDAAQARLQRSSDYDEGSRAFLEKRAPRWTGS